MFESRLTVKIVFYHIFVLLREILFGQDFFLHNILLSGNKNITIVT